MILPVERVYWNEFEFAFKTRLGMRTETSFPEVAGMNPVRKREG